MCGCGRLLSGLLDFGPWGLFFCFGMTVLMRLAGLGMLLGMDIRDEIGRDDMIERKWKCE